MEASGGRKDQKMWNARFYTGAGVIPSKFLSDGVSNPEYQFWDQRDKQLLSWILSSVSTEYLSHVVGCDTSVEVCNRLMMLFQDRCKANVLQYKLQLQTTKKGGDKMSEYLLKIKKLVDCLNYSGCIVFEDDHITYVLSSLGPEYNAVVVMVTT